jgi:hypothetical protein
MHGCYAACPQVYAPKPRRTGLLPRVREGVFMWETAGEGIRIAACVAGWKGVSVL